MITEGTCRSCHQPIRWVRINPNTGYWALTADLQHDERPWGHCLTANPTGGEGHNPNGEFARTDVPALIAEVEQLRALKADFAIVLGWRDDYIADLREAAIAYRRAVVEGSGLEQDHAAAALDAVLMGERLTVARERLNHQQEEVAG